MIKVPYHKQEFWFSCLPACSRMLSEFYNIKAGEKELRKLFKTTAEGGTSWPDVVDGMKELGVNFVNISENYVTIHDPEKGPNRLSRIGYIARK